MGDDDWGLMIEIDRENEGCEACYAIPLSQVY